MQLEDARKLTATKVYRVNPKMTIKAARVNAGLTQQQVTDRTGIARSTLTRWEKGQTKPSKRNLKRLCALYQIDPDRLMME